MNERLYEQYKDLTKEELIEVLNSCDYTTEAKEVSRFVLETKGYNNISDEYKDDSSDYRLSDNTGKKNSIGNFLSGIAYFIFIVGTLGNFALALVLYDSIQLIVTQILTYEFIIIATGALYLGVSEIVQLLHDIRQK